MKHLILHSFHVTYVWERPCADVYFWKKYEREEKSDIKKKKRGGDERKQRLKLTMTIANRWERGVVVVETGLRRHLARGTEEQNAQPCNSTARRIPGHPAFKNANIDASPIALSREAIGVAFEKGATTGKKKKGSSTQRLVLFFFSASRSSPRSCLPIQLWMHPSLAWAPWGVLISNHYLMTGICRQQKRKKKKTGDTQFLSNGRR